MLMATGLKFLEGNEFMLSVRNLHQKGGLYQKAAKTVQAAWAERIRECLSRRSSPESLRTNYGEDRIPHCIKYDLTRFSRLITVVNNGVCIFLFCGDHKK